MHQERIKMTENKNDIPSSSIDGLLKKVDRSNQLLEELLVVQKGARESQKQCFMMLGIILVAYTVFMVSSSQFVM